MGALSVGQGTWVGGRCLCLRVQWRARPGILARPLLITVLTSPGGAWPDVGTLNQQAWAHHSFNLWFQKDKVPARVIRQVSSGTPPVMPRCPCGQPGLTAVSLRPQRRTGQLSTVGNGSGTAHVHPGEKPGGAGWVTVVPGLGPVSLHRLYRTGTG